MDAKVLSSLNFKKPSGISLLFLLAGLLFLFAAIIDWKGIMPLEEKALMSLPLVVCAVISSALGYIVVPILRQLKTGQIIREDGPQSHLQKAGTPTMGGIFFIPVALLAAIIWSKFSLEVIAVSFVTLAYGFIGWIDDWQVLVLKSNKGISPKQKLFLQILVAIVFCAWLFLTEPNTITKVYFPFNLSLSLGFLFWPLAAFVLAAETNATNLTDGVDGLAAGTGAIALLGLGAIVSYNSPELMIFCACMSGACLGFVVHNRNPASVFMGDTGSLALGGALAAVGLISNNLWALFIISGLFFVESVSVIAQVYYYKATKDADGKGKRLLKMAPIHHHLELSGWPETQIVAVFYLVATILAILGIVLS